MPTEAGGLAEPVPEEAGDVVFDVRGSASRTARAGDRRDRADDPRPGDHRVHRPLGLRQEHVPALPQPDERPHRRAPRSTASSLYHGIDLYGPKVDPVEVRRRIGMVFQKPNPFPKSIYDNVAFGPRVNGQRRGLDEVVEHALTKAALWDEVKDKLKKSALRALRRPAAAALHRPRARRRARRRPHGRAVLRRSTRSRPAGSKT